MWHLYIKLECWSSSWDMLTPRVQATRCELVCTWTEMEWAKARTSLSSLLSCVELTMHFLSGRSDRRYAIMTSCWMLLTTNSRQKLESWLLTSEVTLFGGSDVVGTFIWSRGRCWGRTAEARRRLWKLGTRAEPRARQAKWCLETASRTASLPGCDLTQHKFYINKTLIIKLKF